MPTVYIEIPRKKLLVEIFGDFGGKNSCNYFNCAVLLYGVT